MVRTHFQLVNYTDTTGMSHLKISDVCMKLQSSMSAEGGTSAYTNLKKKILLLHAHARYTIHLKQKQVLPTQHDGDHARESTVRHLVGLRQIHYVGAAQYI